MDQRIRDLKKYCVTLDATLTMKTSHYDVLEHDFNIVKLAVEQHTTRLRAMEHPSKGAKKMHHSLSVVPVQSHLPSPSVLSSAMTKHAKTSSVPVRSEHGEEIETIVDINPPSTSASTVTAATTETPAVSPERSTDLALSYSQLSKYLKLKPAVIRTDDFSDFQSVAGRRRPKAKVVSGKSISGNTFKGGPTTHNVFLFRVNRDVSEAIVKKHMNGKYLKYVSIKTISKAEAVFKSFLITVEAKDCGTFMNPDVWPSEPDSGTSGCLTVDYVSMDRTDLRIVSYNCRGFNASKVQCISELLNMCDILLLQETWLYLSQFCLFSTYINNYNNVSICGMDESVIHAGRPYGGCTI